MGASALPMVGQVLSSAVVGDCLAAGGFPSDRGPEAELGKATAEYEAACRLWQKAAAEIESEDQQTLSLLSDQLVSGAGALQTALTSSFGPTYHLVAYATVALVFLSIVIGAAAWAV